MRGTYKVIDPKDRNYLRLSYSKPDQVRVKRNLKNTVTCETCGTKFTASKSINPRSILLRFCSKICRDPAAYEKHKNRVRLMNMKEKLKNLEKARKINEHKKANQDMP